MPLSLWRGSLTKFPRYSAIFPSAEFPNLTFDEVLEKVDFFNPKTVTYKKKSNFFVPCLLKYAPLSNDDDNSIPCKIRSEDHVTEAKMLIVNIDFIDKNLFCKILDRMRRDNVSFAWYPTFAQGCYETDCVKLIVPLDKALNKETYAKAWRGLNNLYFGVYPHFEAYLAKQQAVHTERKLNPIHFQRDPEKHEGGVISTDFLIANSEQAGGDNV
jgi:hypothetical protein